MQTCFRNTFYSGMLLTVPFISYIFITVFKHEHVFYMP